MPERQQIINHKWLFLFMLFVTRFQSVAILFEPKTKAVAILINKKITILRAVNYSVLPLPSRFFRYLTHFD